MRAVAVNTAATYWAHSMGPQRSPLSRVVVVDIDVQAAHDSTASDPW